MPELQKLRTYNFKTDNGVYVSEMFKVNKGIYNYETVLGKKTIAKGKNLGIKTALALEKHIREVIKEFEETGKEIDEEMELEEADELEEMQEAIDEVKAEEVEEDEEEDEDWEEEDDDEDEDEEETEEDEDDESEDEELYALFKEETGKNALTTRGTLRKDFIKWKEGR